MFFGGKVDQRYKQLVRLKLSLLHGCRTCNKQNVPGALAAGTDAGADRCDGELRARARSPDAEKAVIAYADEVALTNTEGRMTPQLFKRLRAHFSEADILELGVTMAIISGMAKLSFVLDVVEKESYCPFAPSASGLSARPHRSEIHTDRMSQRIYPITMPKWGIEMQEGTITAWNVAAGQVIAKGDALLDVETEKIVNSVEAPVSGPLAPDPARTWAAPNRSAR